MLQTVDFPISGIASHTSTHSDYEDVSASSDFSQARLVAWKFRSLLRDISHVEQIIVSESYQALHVYVVVDEVTWSTADQIYSRELRLAEQFPSISFDFNLIRRRGRPLDAFFTISARDVVLSTN